MSKSKGLAHTELHRLGGWLPRHHQHVDGWIRQLKAKAARRPRPLVKPIRAFREMVYSDPVLYGAVAAMFAEARLLRKRTPLGNPEVKTFEEFLTLLNAIMTTAPEYYECKKKGELEPCGLIGFPINALLDWPMGTTSGYDVFANTLVNQQFKKILGYWSQFLVTKASRYVLVEGDPRSTPKVIPWLSKPAKQEMVKVACSAVGQGKGCSGGERFQDIFKCSPDKKYYGFKSWDDFFTRTFRKGVRPVSDRHDEDVIVNACESAPFTLKRNVKLSARFWIKKQPYSLENMLNWDSYTHRFEGGTVYQAFLSALSYHRWQSPVNGVVKKAYVVNGSYYLENIHQGFDHHAPPDAAAPNNSQAFLTAVATRALIFIRADNPRIGLMCFMAVGMAEVSSCEIAVKRGDRVKKGGPLGMFHFGGSTHCLIFRPGVELDFHLYGQQPGPDADTNIRVRTAIATVK